MTLVGAGPGDPDLLTVKALRALQDADVVFYDELVSPEVLDRARRDASRVPVGRRVGKPGIGQDAINRLMIEAAKSGQRAVRLKGGDSFVFGRGGEEVEALRKAGVAYSMIPGITAGLGAAAQFEVPLTFRHEALRITFLTAHKAKDAETVDWSTLTDAKMTVVVYMGMTAAPSVRAGLLAAGRSPQTPVGVFARVTRPDAQAAGRHARPIARSDRTDRRRSRHSHHRRRGRAFRAMAPIQPHIKSSPNFWKLPNDLSARTEENQNHRPVGGDRQPHLGRRRDLSHRPAGLVGQAVRTPRSFAPPTRPARCSPNRSPTMSARSAPISRRSRSRKAARSSPAICANISALQGVTIDLPVPA